MKRPITPLTSLRLILCTCICLILVILSSINLFFLLRWCGYPIDSYPSVVLAQTISTIILFAFPAFYMSWWITGSFTELLKIDRITPPSGRAWLLGIATIILCQPLVTWSAWINQTICKDWDCWNAIFEMSQRYSEMVNKLVQTDTILHFAVSVFIVSILPAVVEEIFFRGTLQNIVLANTKSPTATILITSTVFSIIHVEPSGFLPRLILGIVLGFLYHCGRNIWVNIAAHALNNLVAVIILATAGNEALDSMNQPTENPGVIIPIIGVILLSFAMNGFYNKTKLEQP
ncbi:MAG: CPBP family intramembrane metalloprotease [Marinilabiliaceae bacterium]|nr:CPBP family intramembrane metalloprotease [Marinilabiliaceae bacterium]